MVKSCHECGMENEKWAYSCEHCGAVLLDAGEVKRMTEYWESLPPKPRSAALSAAGFLLLIHGVVSIVVILVIVIVDVLQFEKIFGIPPENEFINLLLGLGMVGILVSSWVISSGYFALKKKHYFFTIDGTWASVFLGLISIFGIAIGIAAAILIYKHREEFKKE